MLLHYVIPGADGKINEKKTLAYHRVHKFTMKMCYGTSPPQCVWSTMATGLRRKRITH